jgi:DNA adenine methylase
MMQVAPDAPSRPALRYHGAKWRLAPWILAHVPPHELYCEPYGGSAAVLLRKERSLLECYNDMDGEVVNFFRVMRDQPGPLIAAIELTPYAKAEWQLSYEPAQDPVEAARRFYLRAYMSIAGPTAQWNTGWRRQKKFSRGTGGENKMTPAPLSFMRVEHLYAVAGRLRGVQIEQDDALAIIQRYDTPETLHYIDPPYVHDTRSKWKNVAYSHEMSDEQHLEMSRILHQVEGMVVISGYRCDLYDELFAGWLRVDRSTRVNGPGSAIESLWLSPRVTARLAHADLPLFAGQEAG